MARRLDIGVASYKNPDKLRATLESIEKHSVTDWRCLVIHNPAEGEADAQARVVIAEFAARNPRFVPVWQEVNTGYAGAVATLQKTAETEYLGYLDNDAEVMTPGWDEKLCSYLDRFHEIGMIFPGGGVRPIDRGNYVEVMWGVGFCWVLNRMVVADVGTFDTEIGHQEEADYCLRVRMGGWKCAAAGEVQVLHHATATNDPKAIERISRGVQNFVNKWCRVFGGKNLNYYSPNVLRWDDWPPNALYLEEWFKLKQPTLNMTPAVVNIEGVEYDIIKVFRLRGFYKGRVI